eukprot:m51a1_g6292 putative high affinity camp-specific and ibmx-insensitive 3 -cyclic phosphodiesterase 8a-like (823) ;mRNA; f:258424-261293
MPLCGSGTTRAHRQRLRLAALEALLGLVAIGAVAVAVVVPWIMARSAGLSSIREVATPLIEKVVASARSEVLGLLSEAVRASLELQENLQASRTLPLGDLRAEMVQFLRCGLRASPEMRLRYIVMGFTDGRMACGWFDRPTRTLYLNDVDRLPNGTLTHQRLYVADPATLWNSSYPDRAEDLGNYDVLPWVLTPNLPPKGSTRWFPEIYTEVEGARLVELLLVLTAPIYSANGEHVATLNIDLILGAITGGPPARVLVVDATGKVIGTSSGEVYRTGPDGVPQTIAATDLSDPMESSQSLAVATHIARNSRDRDYPFYFASDACMTIQALGETVHVSLLPTVDQHGLNWTTIVSVAESDYTNTLYRVSREALVTGIAIVVAMPVVVGGLFAVALRAMYSASRKMLRTEAVQMRTGMDKVVSALKRMRSEGMSRGEVRETVDQVMAALSAGLFHVDLRDKQLDSEQERWIKQEFVPNEQRDSHAGSFFRKALMVVTDETDVPGALPEAPPVLAIPIDSWAFSVLSCGASCFEDVAIAALRHVKYTQVLGVGEDAIKGFVHEIEGLYREENPYHNATHAADVTQAMVALLGGSALALSPLESVSLVLACVVHDVGHPGRNNHFQTAARTDLALLYNDASVLENHHAATAFRVMRAHRLLDRLDGASYAALRKNVIGLILATDMGHHFQIISEFKSLTAAAAAGGLEGSVSGSALLGNEEAKFSAMKMLMKLADASNSARPQPAVAEWAKRVQEEFLAQGDEERALGLPVSAHMDRGDACLAKLQANFLKFICVPMFQAYNDFHAIPTIMAQLADNQRFWESQLL